MARENKIAAGLLVIGGGIAAFLSLRGALGGIVSGTGKPPIPKHKPTGLLGDTGALSLDALYHKHAAINSLDWKLIKAIAMVESSENPSAKNPLDPSYGLMQILCVNKGPNSKCTNDFPAVPMWDHATPNKLITDPDFNVHVGATILAWNIGAYGMPKGIAVYNNWSARNDPPNGPFRNQHYVNKVVNAYNKIKG